MDLKMLKALSGVPSGVLQEGTISSFDEEIGDCEESIKLAKKAKKVLQQGGAALARINYALESRLIAKYITQFEEYSKEVDNLIRECTRIITSLGKLSGPDHRAIANEYLVLKKSAAGLTQTVFNKWEKLSPSHETSLEDLFLNDELKSKTIKTAVGAWDWLNEHAEEMGPSEDMWHSSAKEVLDALED